MELSPLNPIVGSPLATDDVFEELAADTATGDGARCWRATTTPAKAECVTILALYSGAADEPAGSARSVSSNCLRLADSSLRR
jgi:hypothetical protein